MGVSESGWLVWSVVEFVCFYFGSVCGLIVLGWKVGKTLDHALCSVFLFLLEFSCRDTVFGCIH